MNNFRDLKVWQKGIDLVVDIYRMADGLPAKEQYNLVSQMKRAAVSIPSNVAEGCGRHSDPAFKNFCGISLGSAYELETQAIICNRLGYLPENSYQNLLHRIQEVQKMTFGLMSSL